MIDPAREKLLTLQEAARLPAMRGVQAAPHVNALRRWALRGHLEIIKRDRKLLTTAAACERFARRRRQN